jgi:hypothetical protein
VMSPQAMIAPMFGMIMLDKKVPNRWTWTRSPLLDGASCVVVAITDLP